jgi:hypothetical protein
MVGDRKPLAAIVHRTLPAITLLGLCIFAVACRKIPKPPNALRPFFDSLPDWAAIFLALFLAGASTALIFVPEMLKKLEDRKTFRNWLAAILFIVALVFGVGGVYSNVVQKTEDQDERKELRSQISTLINSAQIQATGEDIRKLDADVRDGLDRLAAAMSGGKSAAKSTAKKATAPPETSPPSTPTVENTRLVQRSAPSDDPQLPYGLQVIIQSNIRLEPVAFALECDGEVGKVSFFIAGQGVYMMTQTGVTGDKKNVAFVKFTFPPLTPETPLVVTLLSKSQIRVVRAYKLNP